MKAFITGGNGFVGRHLNQELKNHEVFNFGQDIRDYESLRNALDKFRPDEIYHLAAQAYVPESFINPVRTFEVNTIGSLNLLEAVRQLGIKTRVLLAGTSEEYGGVDDKVTTEKSLPFPQSPYAISKLAMDCLGRLYAKAYGLNVVVTRAFNHAGPGRGEMYAESSWAKQIVEIENGRKGKIKHGNLSSVRNYTDVRDIVRAYTHAIYLPSDVYNICSEQNVTMQEVLDLLIKNAKCEVETEIDPALYRPVDFSFIPPSCEKFKKLTDWETEIPLETTMKDILEHWRANS